MPCLLRVTEIRACRPAVHVFGHDHSAHGGARHGDTLYICGTSVREGTLSAENPPIVFDVPARAPLTST